MERIHREQPMVEDVKFIPVAEQVGTEYRGMAGGCVAPEHLPVDTMEGLLVDKRIPEGYYAKPAAPVVEPEEETTEESL